MAYVRKKKVKGHNYYQLVQNRKVDGTSRQMHLLYLGKHETIGDAEAAWSAELATLESDPSSNGEKEKLRERLSRLRELREAGIV